MRTLVHNSRIMVSCLCLMGMLGVSWPTTAADRQTKKQTKKTTADTEANTAPKAPPKTPTAPPKKQQTNRQTATTATIVLKVINPDAIRPLLKKAAAELGGFHTQVTDSSIDLKLPPPKLSEMIAMAGANGLVIEKNLSRRDLTLRMAELKSLIKSKSEILNRLRNFFDDSDVAATLKIEQNMTQLLSEIEIAKGQLRVLSDEVSWARLSVAFEFKQRDRIVYVNSPFEWLNTVSLDQFLMRFEQ